MNKKIIMVMAVCVLFCLCGCQKSSLPETPEPSAKEENKDTETNAFTGSYKYENDGVKWYINIKPDGTWEQQNEFAEDMDEGTWSFSGDRINVSGEQFSGILTVVGERLVTSDEVYLERSEMPVPDMPDVGKGYAAYTGNWYLSAEIEPKILLIMESDLTFSLRSEKELLIAGEVKQSEEGFDLVVDRSETVATVYIEGESTLVMNIYKSDSLNGLPQTCKFKRG